MRYFTCVLIGLGLAVLSLTALNYSLHELVSVGTCASGGPYVSARQCPHGSMFYGLAIPVGIIGLLVGGAIYAGRGRPPGSEDTGTNWMAGVGSGLLIWSGLFLSIGITLLLSALTEDLGPGGESAGIIIGIVFIPMGAIPLVLALVGGLAKLRSDRRSGSSGGGLKPAAPSGSPSPNPFGGSSGGGTIEGVPGSFGGTSSAPTASAAADWERKLASAQSPGDSGSEKFTSAAHPPKSSTPFSPPTTWSGPLPKSGSGSGDPVKQLERLKSLRDTGVLTDAEFEAAKAKILEEI